MKKLILGIAAIWTSLALPLSSAQAVSILTWQPNSLNNFATIPVGSSVSQAVSAAPDLGAFDFVFGIHTDDPSLTLDATLTNSDFKFLSAPTCNSALACSATLVFNPTATGLENGVLVYALGYTDKITGAHEFATLDQPFSATGTPATPLPSALSLFGTGLGVLGLLARWRKKKAAALAA